jgi:hypothetical protein
MTWKETKHAHDEARRVEHDTVELSQRLGIPDELTRHRKQADELAAAERVETQRRIREARRERRERERDRTESAAVTELRSELEALHGAISEGDARVLNTVAEVISSLPFDKIADKLSKLEELLNRMRSLSAAERDPMDLPSLRSLRSHREVN